MPDAPGPLQDLLLTRERLVLIGEGFIGITDRAGQATTRWADVDLPGAVAACADLATTTLRSPC